MATSELRTRPAPRTSVWLAESRVPSGRQDGLDRDKITEASVRLLDADGLEKFSMRRLAAELGVTAMSVYWYVHSKDHVLELALDAVEGEIALPGPHETSADWPDQLRQLAYGYRRMFHDHPWASRMAGSCLNVGPRAMAFADATRRIMAGSGLPEDQRIGGLSALFQFVLGFSTVEAHWNGRCREAGLATDEYQAAVQAKIRARAEYADAARLPDEPGGETAAGVGERDFAAALDCVIAGLEALQERNERHRHRPRRPSRRSTGSLREGQ